MSRIILFLFVISLPSNNMVTAQTFTSITTPARGEHYKLSTQTYNYTEAETACQTVGLEPAAFPDNAMFADLLDYLTAASPAYDRDTFWVNTITESSAPKRYFLAGGEQVSSDKWFTSEPNGNCGSNCCYLLTRSSGSKSEPTHKLADDTCTTSFLVICGQAVGSAETTTAAATVATTTATTVLTTATTAATAAAAALETTTQVELAFSTGQQMAIMYLGLILGLAFGTSCFCAGMWLAINRCRRRCKKGETEKNAEDTFTDSDDSDHSDDNQGDDHAGHTIDDHNAEDCANLPDKDNPICASQDKPETKVEVQADNEGFEDDDKKADENAASDLEDQIVLTHEDHIEQDRVHIKLAKSAIQPRPSPSLSGFATWPNPVDDQGSSTVTTAVELNGDFLLGYPRLNNRLGDIERLAKSDC